MPLPFLLNCSPRQLADNPRQPSFWGHRKHFEEVKKSIGATLKVVLQFVPTDAKVPKGIFQWLREVKTKNDFFSKSLDTKWKK